MKAISLWQPWASAIACGMKRIETRSWHTTYRGPIAIHAAKKWDGDLRVTSNLLIGQWPEFWDALGPMREHGLGNFPLGYVLCTADLVACTATETLLRRISPREKALGNYSEGRWGWELENVKPLSPLPLARGFQQLWEWNP